MNSPQRKTESNADSRYLSATHEVINQPPRPLENYNLYEQDSALREAVLREGAGHASEDLSRFGAWAGKADTIELGNLANANKPSFRTHDRYGHRVDEVTFHPAYHELMRVALENGLHSSPPWTNPGKGAHVARAAKYYLHSQVEAAHCCPVTMTFAAIPSIQNQPDLAKLWAPPKILANEYDSRNVPDGDKTSVTIGMAMTENRVAATCAPTPPWPTRQARKVPDRPTNWSATNGSFPPPPCATPSWYWPRPPMACPAS